MYSVEIKSSFEELWRYNFMVMCAGYDSSGEQLFVETLQDCIAEIGAELKVKPSDYPLSRVVRLQAPAAHHFGLLVYLVPHTLPSGNEVGESDPFDINVEITLCERVVYSAAAEVNQWSGVSLNIEI